MKRFLFSAFWVVFFFLFYREINAQRVRYYRPYPVYRTRPVIAVGVGGLFGGYWGPAVGVGVNVVLPPPGARTHHLPVGAVRKEINGITYYYKNNTYFREREDGGFEVVEPPVGATLHRIPIGAKLTKINGKYYYEKDGVFYYKDRDDAGNTVYIIKGKNGELYTDEKEDAERTPSYRYEESSGDEVPSHSSKDSSSFYFIEPEIGDRFEQLPKNSREVIVDGEKQYVSPNGFYYKEVREDGKVLYEVVKKKP